MSDTLLILHVKGTEADTTALPRHAVQSALTDGQITNSQLIWSVQENTWKQAREYPGLVPVEDLILHVKGTQAETRQLPKPAVRNALSQGQITHSQLIWSPVDSSWKQAREFPDLLPTEQLILHVKGTEAETKEMPKRAIRKAISQGEITHSQLIWSPAQNSWKQVRELPDLLPSQKLAPAPAPSRAVVSPQPRIGEAIIMESPGGPVARAAATAGAANVPQARVASTGASVPQARAAVEGPPKVRVRPAASTAAPQPRVAAAGEIVPQARLAGAAAEAESAPQVRAAVPAEAAPQVRAATPTEGAPQVRVAVAKAEGSTPQVRVAAAAASAPQVRVAAAAPVVQAAAPVSAKPARSLKVKEEEGPHPLKWLCIGLGVFIVAIVGANYLLVDQPLVSNMSKSSFPTVTEYAHFGAFLQPNVLVIHIPTSATLTPDNLTDYLVTLARNTPENPLTKDLFARVAVTSGWTAQYSFSGFSWKEIGGMGHEDKAQLKEDIMERLGDAAGQPMMPESTLNLSAREAKQDRVWKTFVAHFTGGAATP